MKDIIIIGGGLAGLSNAIQLSAAGLQVVVIEKKQYPFHRVCGEYISNEVLPFLKSIGVDLELLYTAKISRLLVSAPSVNKLEMPLSLGGFGLSRFALDEYLYKIALAKGAHFLLNTSATEVTFNNESFQVSLSDGSILKSKIVIGAFGKRSNLDRQLQRNFFLKKSPYLAVKYHIRTDFPSDQIALHNFKDGYCGISKVEADKYCLCYMTSSENLRQSGSIGEMEKNILHKNPFLKELFENAQFIFEKPEVINEISFDKKTAVENHILMSGDAAGMITPLCGNGMAMALHASKILSTLILQHYPKRSFNRSLLEQQYHAEWTALFERRLFMGRKIQQLFGKEFLTNLSVSLLKNAQPLGRWLVKQTHGQGF